jgi:hypothetical protein
MRHERIHIPIKSPAKSLCWYGDGLVDWAIGGVLYQLNGKIEDSLTRRAYRFDAAVMSPSGRYAVIYERLGTKGLLLDHGQPVREVNRSYYHADTYEYPIVLFEHLDGRTLMAHCPDEYDRIQIDDVLTGERLTVATSGEHYDMFHSRLTVSPGGTRMLSAGWIWHPLDTVSTWHLDEVLADGRLLDTPGPPDSEGIVDLCSATFIDDDRIVICSGVDDWEVASFPPRSIGVYNLETLQLESVVNVEETVGTMMWLGDGLVVGFYESPKVFDLTTGKVVHRWPDISSGAQTSSIIHYLKDQPTVVCDPIGRRFAVTSESGIDVVLF